MSALRWTCKSLRRPAAELEEQGHPINHTLVGELLTQQKFSLQANSKTKRGRRQPGSRRPVLPHQAGRGGTGGKATGDISGHKEERARRRPSGQAVSKTYAAMSSSARRLGCVSHFMPSGATTSARSVSSSDRGNDPERVIERSTPDDPDKPRKASARPRSVG
jgi:hypothetical protein